MGDQYRRSSRRRADQAREIATERLRAVLGRPLGDDPDLGAGDPAGAGAGLTWRIDPGRRGAVAVLVAVIVIGAVMGWRVLTDRPQSRPVPVSANLAAPATTATRVTTGPGATPSTTRSVGGAVAAVVVDVVGRVQRPGIVRLTVGARVDDAVRAAGGALPGTDLTTLNLARVLVDGEQIAVGVPTAGTGAVVTAANGGGGTAGPTGGGGPKVNLNTATLEQLDGLPGVGPVLAQRIVDWRTAHGRFESVDQLQQVSGVGAAKFADLKPLVAV